MKKLLLAITAVCIIGCTSNQFYSASEDALLSAGIAEGLKYGVKDAGRRTVIANYADDIAVGVRTVTGTPTPDQLTAYILTFVPANIRTQFPEIASIVVPLVVSGYEAALAKYGSNAAAVYPVLNRIATDIENGVSAYISPGHTVSP